MQVHAITKNVRMSAQKMREMVRQIQGLTASQAEAVLKVVPRKSARVVAKTLKSAIANAEDLKQHKPEFNALRRHLNADFVLEIFDQSQRGSAGRILLGAVMRFDQIDLKRWPQQASGLSSKMVQNRHAHGRIRRHHHRRRSSQNPDGIKRIAR